ncbi:hypothetical protein [Flammeovirga sp. SubArs3]|nr:hypothetical protein [Flammeovirga sp. SubArs3]
MVDNNVNKDHLALASNHGASLAPKRNNPAIMQGKNIGWRTTEII